MRSRQNGCPTTRRGAVMETWDAVRARRNVRSFTDKAIADNDLDQVLEAGRRAPSASNTQPWDFVVVTERGDLSELALAWRGAGHIARSAATIVILPPIPHHPRQAGRLTDDLGPATPQRAVV